MILVLKHENTPHLVLELKHKGEKFYIEECEAQAVQMHSEYSRWYVWHMFHIHLA